MSAQGLVHMNAFVFQREMGQAAWMTDAVDALFAQVHELLPSLQHDVTLAQPAVAILEPAPRAAPLRAPLARMWRESAGAACAHLTVVNPHSEPLPFALKLAELTAAEMAALLAQGGGGASFGGGLRPLFDGSCESNPANIGGADTRDGAPEFVCRVVNVTRGEAPGEVSSRGLCTPCCQ